MPEAHHHRKADPPSFPALVQQFFTEYLVAQRALSPRTVASYRDAMTLFLAYVTEHLGKAPMTLRLKDITPDLVLKFLAHLERERQNSVRSRNLRLTALRAFLKFAGRRDVSALHAVEQVMALPMKRFERPLLGHLTRPEMIAVLGQPGSGWTSQRDHLLLSLLYNTGARVSEIVGVRVVDVVLWAVRPASICMARDARIARCRRGSRPQRPCGRGCMPTPICAVRQRCCPIDLATR